MKALWRRLGDKIPLLRFIDSTLLRFGSVGAITTILDFVVFSLLTKIIGLPPILSNVMSYSCGIALSFILNRNWTFGAKAPSKVAAKQGFQFMLANLAGLIFSSILVGLFVQVMPELVAKLVSIPIVFIWNYLSARFWVFKN